MNNFDKIAPEKVDELIDLVSTKTGASKENLKNIVQSGQIEKLVNNLKPNQASRLQAILSDKKAAEELLSTPQAQQLLKKILQSK